ncbi:hypothetical protein L593_13275 [Salinarchaeum sp. Harcht-Bsk1]|uniref:M66 family metalloprotease n=1 Tax=Salinarchaeum sp. Harcht-Bsk1 TaxID=1333523 RepID=UPI000342492E|nr:M66 family metalloprotease [Salinarchaeum sp. Harcht-Bsk1]AGN02594.1 hypothetical protein L593_13275 [Salinarchaeum sp. Harcht-Bsk1]
MLACESVQRAIVDCLPADVTCRIGPHGIAELPGEQGQSIRSTIEWWRSHRPREYVDAEVLVCSSAVTWEYGGMVEELGGRVGVASYGDWMEDPRYRRILLHEVGHCLGMRHEHGRRWSTDGESVATAMAPVYPARSPLDYSDEAAAELRRYAGVE